MDTVESNRQVANIYISNKSQFLLADLIQSKSGFDVRPILTKHGEKFIAKLVQNPFPEEDLEFFGTYIIYIE